MSMCIGPPSPMLCMYERQVVMASSRVSYMKSSLIMAPKVMMNHVLHDWARASTSVSGERCWWQPTRMLPSVMPFWQSTAVSVVTVPSESMVSACAVLKVEPGARGLPMAWRTSLPWGVFVAKQSSSPLAGLMATTLPVFP